MQKLVPQKLKQGDEIRVVAPSTGIKIIGADCRKIAEERFGALGLKVRFGRHTTDENFDMFGSSPAALRAEDLMEAFADDGVKAIFTVIGGFNSNQILPLLDYEVIKKNPKILCGFSDITALLNGIRAKTGLTVFYGPHYSSLGMLQGCDYTLDMMQKMLFEGQADWRPSSTWSDDLWFLDQEKRQMIPNEGPYVIHSGKATGVLEGGNLGTLTLLNGTPYQPLWQQDTILALEDCFTSAAADAKYFLRQFEALTQRPDFSNVRAVLIGRFQKGSKITRAMLEDIVNSLPACKNLPVFAEMDFGHTTPIATLPLGGRVELDEQGLRVSW